MKPTKRSRVYRFPENQRAAAQTLGAQLGKVAEETREAVAAFDGAEGDDRIIEELWDVIQAAEGALRKFHPARVSLGLVYVVFKSIMRGDYMKGGKR